MAVLDGGVLTLQLTQGAFEHLVGHGTGEHDHQIGTAQLLFQPAPGLRKHFRLTLIGLTKILVPAFHTLISA